MSNAATIAASHPANGGPSAEDDRELVDRIVYLASLASAREAVDPMLDTLRIITASTPPGQAFSQNDRKSLETLESKVRNYLLHDDPLRAFTADSLSKRLHEQEHGSRVKPGQFFLAVLISVGAGLLPAALPPYSELPTRLAIFSVPIFFLVLALSTAWFYFTSLNNFKPELKRAFVLLCVGVILLSFAFSHYAIIQAFNLGQYPVFKYGGITWSLTLAWFFIYLGLRVYARLLQIKTRFMSLPLFTLVGLAAAAFAWFVPHMSNIDEELFFDISLAGESVLAVTTGFAALVSRAIARSVTPAYAKSLRWLYYYCVYATLAAIGGVASFIVLGPLEGALLNIMTLVLGLVPQLLLLYTGYSFKRETSQ